METKILIIFIFIRDSLERLLSIEDFYICFLLLKF